MAPPKKQAKARRTAKPAQPAKPEPKAESILSDPAMENQVRAMMASPMDCAITILSVRKLEDRNRVLAAAVKQLEGAQARFEKKCDEVITLTAERSRLEKELKGADTWKTAAQQLEALNNQGAAAVDKFLRGVGVSSLDHAALAFNDMRERLRKWEGQVAIKQGDLDALKTFARLLNRCNGAAA